MAFFELRRYRTKPGQRDNWVKYMEETVIPFQISKGMADCRKFRWRRGRRFVHLDSPF